MHLRGLDMSDIERLFAEHADGLYGFLAYRTGDPSLAQDLVADTFERAFRGKHRFDRLRGSEKTWLYTIALNLVRDHGRRKVAEGRALEETATIMRGRNGAGPHEAVAARDLVSRALDALPAEQREMIALRYGAELSVPELAAVTKQSLRGVEGRLYRGLKQLRNELTDRPAERARSAG
jgi:RNA polymerase sigma-70 factor, ECF subfamily